MTLTQFVQTVALMRQAQKKKADTNATKWITQSLRMEHIVDNILEEFFKKQVDDIPQQASLFPPE